MPPETTDRPQDLTAREAALRDVLSVMARSRHDRGPVFDAILRNAVTLCDTAHGSLFLISEDRNRFELAASYGSNREIDEIWRTKPANDVTSSFVLAALTRAPVHIPDSRDTDRYRSGAPDRTMSVDRFNIRTLLQVPLLTMEDCIGVLTVYRHEVRPFDDDQIALLQTFAEQAVMAIENVRQFQNVAARLDREAALREIMQVISQSRDDDQPVFDRIVDLAQKLCGARSAMLIMGSAGDPAQRLVAHRDVPDETVTIYDKGGVSMDPKTDFAARAILEKQVMHIEDMRATPDDRSGGSPSRTLIDGMGAGSRLIVPLVSQGDGIGCLCLPRDEPRPFSKDDILLVQSFAAQAVIAIENVRQFRALQEKTREVQLLNAGLEQRVLAQVGEIERISRLRQFLSPAVADAVVTAGDDALLRSHRALIATLFCDIRGFTAFCEAAEPEETIEVLKTYHEAMGELIAAHGGGVDHRMGDGIMVIFNDPLPCDDPTGDALGLAFAMRARMAGICTAWNRLGHRLGFGVGISLGYATVGMVGASGRYEYTASGTAVNLAARLCDQAADGEILLSPRAHAAVEDRLHTEPVGEMELKGIRAPIQVVRAMGWREVQTPSGG
ncbi:MAG: GAF domain-containing protein [Pseudomonadota bacterium]